VAVARAAAADRGRRRALLARLGPGGLAGQFVVGALLGALWTPCGGPTLGAAIGSRRSAAARRRGRGDGGLQSRRGGPGAAARLWLARLAARPDRLALVTRLGKPPSAWRSCCSAC